MKMLDVLRQAVLVSLVLVAGFAGAEELAPEGEQEGVIQELDFGANTTLINGSTYHVSPTARVQIAGSYGAFTMLEPGMKVEFTYLHFSDGVRRIISMREVAEVEEI